MNTAFLRLACHLLLTALAALVTELLALALLRLLLGPLRVCAIVLGVGLLGLAGVQPLLLILGAGLVWWLLRSRRGKSAPTGVAPDQP
jgi:hypothetical protein